MEWLLVAVVVVVGWLVVQTMRARAAQTPPRATAQAPLPETFVTHPPDLVGSRVRVTHPLVRKAAEHAATQGNRYVQREGDDLYFVLDGIEDPEERRRAHDLLSRSQSGEEVASDEPDIQEMVWVARLLGKG